MILSKKVVSSGDTILFLSFIRPVMQKLIYGNYTIPLHTVVQKIDLWGLYNNFIIKKVFPMMKRNYCFPSFPEKNVAFGWRYNEFMQ